MPALPPRSRRTICLVALGLCLGGVASGADEPAQEEAVTAIILRNQTPADFLDAIGQRTKARWRLLFRPPPPTPPTDRGRASLILGSLMADSFLIWQAGDSQQFRNNNQEVLAYCRTLGLGEKLLPRLMTQGNLAEQNAWKELRQELVEGHQEALRLLREQMDEDLALLIDIGVGLRLMEIVAAIIVAAPESDVRGLCSGTPDLLQDLRENCGRISAEKRELPLLTRIRSTVDQTSQAWKNVEATPLTQEQAAETSEKLKALMQEMVTK